MSKPKIDRPVQIANQEGPPGYNAARTSSAFYPVPEAGVLKIGGADRSAFLQRQTTNDLKRLTPGHILTTILTSPTGRVLDVLTLLNLPGEDPETGAYLAITLPGRGSRTAEFLNKKIFFMDRVTVEDASSTYRVIALEGPKTSTTLEAAGLPSPLPAHEIFLGTLDGSPLWIFSDPAPGGGVRLVTAEMHTTRLSELLRQAGAAALVTETVEILRVERGQPGFQHELNGDYTPLETNLAWAISSTKGCYTGQEVIARQITYDKVTRQLVGLRLSDNTQPGDQVWLEGKVVGVITSFAISPAAGPLGLAVLKRPFNQPGTQVLVGDPKAGHEGRVAALPFSLESSGSLP